MNKGIWTISFQHWNIVFCPAELEAVIPEQYRICDDSDLGKAWAMLVEEHHNVWVKTSSMLRAARFVMAKHIYIKAAGGIVTNPEGDALLIYRNNHWDLPKGMIEKGETPEKGAVREVEEETGLASPKIERLLLESFHIYDLYGGWHIKRTYWYQMTCEGSQQIQPQTEEGITECRWCRPEDRHKYLSDSYAMMKMIDERL